MLTPLSEHCFPAIRMTSHGHAFDYLVVLDFESTCDEPVQPKVREVIEFPSVLLKLTESDDTQCEIIDQFQQYTTANAKLTPFCTQLTGISQETVDSSGIPFGEALENHTQWLIGHGLLDEVTRQPIKKFTFVTVGDWDLEKMIIQQCETSGLNKSARSHFRSWINLKLPCKDHLRQKEDSGQEGGSGKAAAGETKSSGGGDGGGGGGGGGRRRRQRKQPKGGNDRGWGMKAMMAKLNVEMAEGTTHHCGIDDCINTAGIVQAMIKDGYKFTDVTGGDLTWLTQFQYM